MNDDDDVPQIQNAPQQGANMPGPLSQEGRQFQRQIPPDLPSQPPVPTQPPMPIPLQQPVPIQPPIPIPSPVQIVGGVRHALANRKYVGHAARQQHPRWPNKLWCTKGRHWVESAVFGRLLTCETCRAIDHARTARLRDEQLAQEAQVAAQLQLVAQIGGNGPQNPPLVDNNNPPPIPTPVDPLSAISAEDKILLENCRNKLKDIVMESCDL